MTTRTDRLAQLEATYRRMADAEEIKKWIEATGGTVELK